MQTVLKALVWTFVHSLWQGLLAALIAALIIAVTRKTRARRRYNLLGLVLIAFIVTSFITFLVQLNSAYETLPVNSSAVVIETSNNYPGLMTSLSNWFDRNVELVTFIWSIFFFIHCLQLFVGIVSVRRLRYYKTYPVAEEWKVKLSQLCELLRIRKPVSLVQSGLIKVPVVIGFLKPVILLPIGLLNHLPPEQVETILVHELGHIKRRDWIINFLQHFVEAVFFFNPAVRWISSLLREEREACCDDIVLDHGQGKRNYFNALVNFHEYANEAAYAMAFKNRKQYLLHRIKRMVTQENKRLSIAEKLGLFCGVFLFSAFTYIDHVSMTRAHTKSIVAVQSMEPVQADANTQTDLQMSPGTQAAKDEKEKTITAYRPLSDTVPPKNKKKPVVEKKVKPAAAIEKPKPGEKEKPVVKEKEAKDVLKEIEQLKEQIGVKKESIGDKKEKLKDQSNDTREIQKEIDQERRELDKKREELDDKRVEYQKLKSKQQITKEIEKTKEIEERKEKTKEIELKKENEKSKEIELKTAPEKSKEIEVKKENDQVLFKKEDPDKSYLFKKAESKKEPVKFEKKTYHFKPYKKTEKNQQFDKSDLFNKPEKFNSFDQADKPDQFGTKSREAPAKPVTPAQPPPKEAPPVKTFQYR